MGRMGSTTSARARQMRRELGRWQRSGLKLREYGQQHGIPQSTLTWWRRVFRHAGEQGNAASKRVHASDVVVWTEVPQPENLPRRPSVVEIVLHNGHLVRRQLFWPAVLPQPKTLLCDNRRYPSGVVGEEGLPLLAPPRERQSTLSGTISSIVGALSITKASSAAIPWPSLGELIYLASMIQESSGSEDFPGFEFGSADGACGEHELSRPLRAPGLHAPLQAPELGAGRIEIWKLLG